MHLRKERAHADFVSVAKLRPCGSGAPRRELRDAMNIFCAFVCDGCEAEKRAAFDPRIFSADPYPADEPIFTLAADDNIEVLSARSRPGPLPSI